MLLLVTLQFIKEYRLFGQLPRLFDRGFAIGYFLPVVVFVAASYVLLTGLNVWTYLFPAPSENNAPVYGSVLVVASWFLAMLLLAANRPLYRLKEGYWVPRFFYEGRRRQKLVDEDEKLAKAIEQKREELKNECKKGSINLYGLHVKRFGLGLRLRPLYKPKKGRWLPRFHYGKRRYTEFKYEQEDLEKAIIRENNQLKEAGKKESEELKRLHGKWDKVLQEKAEEFPDKDYLLPTRFGNIMRSFEVYSRLVYGFEDIQGWSRLLAVIPKDYREMVDSAKAKVDFWLNLWFFSALLVIEYVIVVVLDIIGYANHPEKLFGLILFLVYPVVAFVLAFLASWGARGAAISWGDYVKASHDIFLPELGKKLGFPPATREQQKTLWTLLSKVIVYRLPEHIDELLDLQLVDTFEDSTDANHFGVVQRLAKQIISSNSKVADLRSQLDSCKQEESKLRAEVERITRERVRESNEHSQTQAGRPSLAEENEAE